MSQPTLEQSLQLAVQHHQAGRLQQAEQLCRQILSQNPRHPAALHLLGVIALQGGRSEIAIDYIRQSLDLHPQNPLAYFHLGSAHLAKNQFDDAIAAFRQVTILDPQSAIAHNNFGFALAEKGLHAEAVAAFRQASTLQPDNADISSNLGNALRDNGQPKEAIAACRRAIALQPNFAEAHSNLGSSLRDVGHFDEAVAAFRRAIHLDPNFPQSHYNLGTALLASGDLHQGWEEYEWRWQCKISHLHRESPQKNYGTVPLSMAAPFSSMPNKASETPCNSSAISHSSRKCGGKILVECQPPLGRLLQSITENCPIVSPGGPTPEFDVHSPLLTLPKLFGTTLANIPHDVPYLQASAHDIKKWRDRVASNNSRIKVGLAWAGSPGYKGDRNRSIPPSLFAPLAACPNIQLFSLQKPPLSQPVPFPLIDLMSEVTDFADTAALIANLDLVISVDTAIAHLAGALAKPVWTLLPFAPDWRWLLHRTDSPWYPTMRLFRQSAINDWPTVMHQLADALTNFRNS